MDKNSGASHPRAYRKAYDQATNSPVPFRDLVYSMREWEVKASENLLPYSNYDSTGWACSAGDEGAISVGPFPDTNLVSYALDNTATENGVQTWSGSGTARTTIGVDLTNVSVVCFAVEFGAYQRSSIRTFTVALGVCNEDGSNPIVIRNWDLTSGKKIWFSTPVAGFVPAVSQTDVCFYLDVTCDANAWWYFCSAQVERERSEPGPYRRTSGASVVYAADAFKRGVAKIDYHQYEELRHPQDAVVNPREGTDQSAKGIPSEVEP